MRRTGAILLSLSIAAEEAGCREELLEATLSLEDDGDWELEMTKRETCGESVDDGMTLRYQRQ